MESPLCPFEDPPLTAEVIDHLGMTVAQTDFMSASSVGCSPISSLPNPHLGAVIPRGWCLGWDKLL